MPDEGHVPEAYDVLIVHTYQRNTGSYRRRYLKFEMASQSVSPASKAETDIIKPFDCGDFDLNGFLLESNEADAHIQLSKFEAFLRTSKIHYTLNNLNNSHLQLRIMSIPQN